MDLLWTGDSYIIQGFFFWILIFRITQNLVLVFLAHPLKAHLLILNHTLADIRAAGGCGLQMTSVAVFCLDEKPAAYCPKMAGGVPMKQALWLQGSWQSPLERSLRSFGAENKTWLLEIFLLQALLTWQLSRSQLSTLVIIFSISRGE